jgi:hypothetical protein
MRDEMREPRPFAKLRSLRELRVKAFAIPHPPHNRRAHRVKALAVALLTIHHSPASPLLNFL